MNSGAAANFPSMLLSVCLDPIFGNWVTLSLQMASIFPLDLDWTGRPRSIACALLQADGYAALVDPGPASTLPTLRSQLAVRGLRVADLQAVFLTHIHLDHAGATGSLVQENPRLEVYVHTLGAVHMANPARLIDSASRLYGEDLAVLFGEFLAVPSANLRALAGGERIAFGPSELQVLYTPGHASHHVTYFEPGLGVAFVGDTAGICVEGHPFILPATPPPDISLELWEASLDAIANLHAKRLFLTHFSFADNPVEHIATYRKRLHQWSDLAANILARELDANGSVHTFAKEVAAEAAQFLSPDEISHYVFNGALNLSWLGLARYHRKRSTPAS